MKFMEIKSARKRRLHILGSTNKTISIENRYKQAYRKTINIKKNTLNPLTRLKASSDADYFKRKVERYK